ncbi:hypothetical protein ACTFIY_009935 [Dictyostelium cf. discoideum]
MKNKELSQTPLLNNDHQEENDYYSHSKPIQNKNNNKINIIILGLCFCILFSAFSPTQILQTTINQNLGYYTLAVLYSSLSISNFISPFIVSKFGEKISLIIGTLSYAMYIGSNIYVTQTSLYISSILVGFGGAILWNAQGSLIIKYSTEETIGPNTGLFFALFQTDQIIGNLGSATLINKAGLSNNILFSIFMGISIIPIIGFLFLNCPITTKIKKTIKPINIQDEEETKGNQENHDGDDDDLSIKNIFKSIIILFKDKPIQLLIPSLVYSGISQTFFFGVFSSLIGVEWVGYVMSVFGFFDALSSFILGKLSYKIGRKILILISTISSIIGTILIILVNQSKIIHFSTANNDNNNNYGEYKILFYFIGSALLGFSDAGFNTQLYSLLGVLYPTNGEAAVGVFKFVQSTATAVAFIYGPYASLFENIFVLDCFVIISCVFFIFADNFSKSI